MHQPLGGFAYPFKSHALVHHRIFKSDHTYHLIHEADKRTIPMAWWNGPVLIAVGLLPFVLAALLSGQWGILAGAVVACGGYYGAYEYLHWCMHLPRKRHVERSGIFFRLNGHHLLHHRYMGKNFNVVLPLADLCLGTLLLRSKIHFKQAVGPSVPDVQPRTPRPQIVPAS
jgi:sterol desaturase/sphingolipid hydroxylase (fatty acid hydroxylase superfamily)